MKIDKNAYKDRKEIQSGITVYFAFRFEKVLFFEDSHFLSFKSQPILHTLASRTSRQTNKGLPKSALFQRALLNILE